MRIWGLFFRTIALLMLRLPLAAAPSAPSDPPTPPAPPPTGHTPNVIALYRKADSYFTRRHPTPATDSMALRLFSELTAQAPSGNLPPELIFQSWLKKGIILDVGNRCSEALDAYAGAIGCLHGHPGWSDSLYFKVYVYAGADYYRLENFDSAYSLLNKAEELADRYPGLTEKDRVYNTLGALYYESGNYLQARNYFTHALAIIQAERPGDKASAVNFQNNIAGCLYKLGDYQRSIDLYTRLTGGGIFSSQIWLNMGKSYAELKDYARAMSCFRQAKPEEVPGVYNEMAYTQYLLGNNDSAVFFLDEFNAQGHPARSVDAGVNDLYRGQVLMTQHHPLEAMNAFQRAILTFSGNFTDPDIHHNPLNFTGAFSSYRLFDAIVCKAAAWEGLYTLYHREEYLQGAWAAYNSAILLFRHIEKTYTTDDARLFLKKNNRDLYHRAFTVCLDLDSLHPGRGYLQQAFLIAEKSKASILSANLDFMSSGHNLDPKILQRLRTLKYGIARLELRNDPEQGNIPSGEIAARKAGYEMELSRLQKNLETSSAGYKLQLEDSGFTVRELQEGLNDQQALISLYVTPEGLHIFTLTGESFRHLRIDSMPALSRVARQWIGMLNNPDPGRRFGNRLVETALYRQLVSPLLHALPDKEEWIIIPDDIFDLLPFESLPADEDGAPLIETRTISYQLSAKLLNRSLTQHSTLFRRYAVLAFAPFADSGGWVNTSPLRHLERLPSSGGEIDGLQGRLYFNAQATKDRFLQELNHFPVIHLATHALSDPQDSGGSRICFFPRHKGPVEDCLFLPELYGLNMDSTDLVILSTCESGTGEIVDNEGMISLSRGFLYAGCASTVNSLWKADDESTEAILRKFHFYLEKGYNKAAALRQAKLDYIHGDAIYTSPNFWAHLVLVGNTDPVTITEKNSALQWGLIIGAIGLFPLLIGLISAYRRSRSLHR